jgi:Domain of unknown function (DUF1772)
VNADDANGWLLAAVALHAGFQLTVTAIVYPALASTPDDDWAEAHARHSRRIAPLVALVYGAAVVACALAATADASLGTWVALAGTAVAILVTATVAAPLHGRLDARDPALLARLLAADRVRCVSAFLSVAGALGAVLV